MVEEETLKVMGEEEVMGEEAQEAHRVGKETLMLVVEETPVGV